MKEGIKCAAVFIGTVIGAGFATGQEVLLYFGKSAPVVAVFSGFLLGAFCAFFMWLGSLAQGKSDGEFLFGSIKPFYDAIVFICAYITFTAMFAGAEVLIESIFNVAHIGVLSVLAAAFAAAKGLKGLKLINLFAVPLIVVFIALIFVKNGVFAKKGSYNPLNAVAYAAMNIMLAGNVMFRLGKKSSGKAAWTAGVVSGLILGAMLGMLTLIVGSKGGEMPVFAAAAACGLASAGGVVIFLAVFTTMVSALEQAAEKLSAVMPHKFLAVPTVCLAAYPVVIFFSFYQIVNYFYPVVSVCGFLLLGASVYAALRRRNENCVS